MEAFDTQSLFWLAPLLVWSVVWQGIALWKAAQKNDKVWFIVLLLVHTAGLLEILYIYVFSRDKNMLADDNKQEVK